MKIFTLFLLASIAGLGQTVGIVPKVYYASQSGAKLDCIISGTDLNAGKQIGTLGACTNNDALMNGILATATANSPVTLIVDGPTITRGIVGPATGYWTIDCLNTGNGFYMAPGSNAHAIRNVPGQFAYNTAQAPGTPGKNIQIRNCYINGNRGDGTNGNSNSGNPRQVASGYWLLGIYLDNMTGVAIENVSLYNSPSFQLTLNACSDCVVSGLRVDNNVPTAINMDGIHIDGPSSQIRISDVWLNTNDDGIALNAAEGYGGTIRDVSISGAHCNVCLSALRVLTNEDGGAANSAIQNVAFTNGSGTIADSLHPSNAFVIGYAHSSTAASDIIQSVRISNSTYTTTNAGATFAYVSDNVGELSFNNVTWMAPAGATPWLGFGQASTISSFSCTACKIIRNVAGHGAAYWAQIPSGASVQRMEFNGVSVENGQGQNYSALSYAIDVQTGGSVGTLALTSLDPLNISSLLNGNQWARVTRFYGPGVSTFFRNVTYASLPPATYCGLSASISDSNAGGVWGATEGGGSAGHFAQLGSNCTNWTVTGK